MNPTDLANQAQALAERAGALAAQAKVLAETHVAPVAAAADPFLFLLTIFLLACFVGYYVVWNVTPALHSPLMGVTNAISSVIVVGAILATGLGESTAARVFGFLAAMLAAVNIFGGFIVTRRMLAMFQTKKKG
jgi:NAD(P) transhydrogenase subunit alpha